MIRREALWDEDFDYLFGDRDVHWWDGDVAEPAVAGDVRVLERRETARYDVPSGPRGDGAGRASSQLSSIRSWTPSAQPRRRPSVDARQTRITIIAVVATAVVVLAALLIWRLSTGGAEDAPAPEVTPSSTQPTLSSGAPTPSAPPMPPPLPPPPPPPADQGPRWQPTYQQEPKPEIGVTRTPVTRMPLSVAPKPVTPPKTATPGGPH